MRIGMVAPYALGVPGGVGRHVLDLASALRRGGHDVDVLAPGGYGARPGPSVTLAGRGVGVPYNGSTARLTLGPGAWLTARRWVRAGRFDVLHLHEPTAPSLSFLALCSATGPVVATFHVSIVRSRVLAACRPILIPRMERVTARIAVSEAARRVQLEHLGGDAVVVPNGVEIARFADAEPMPLPPGGPVVGFVGRFDEPRKGMAVLLAALRLLDPSVRLLVVGDGDRAGLLRAAGPQLAPRITMLGSVTEELKARALAAVDLLVVPATGGESFGVVLAEAMAAGTAVVASDLDAFRRVLTPPGGSPAGLLVPPRDPVALADGLTGLLARPARRAELVALGSQRVRAFDWSVVTATVLRVYQTALAADPRGTRRPATLAWPP